MMFDLNLQTICINVSLKRITSTKGFRRFLIRIKWFRWLSCLRETSKVLWSNWVLLEVFKTWGLKTIPAPSRSKIKTSKSELRTQTCFTPKEINKQAIRMNFSRPSTLIKTKNKAGSENSTPKVHICTMIQLSARNLIINNMFWTKLRILKLVAQTDSKPSKILPKYQTGNWTSSLRVATILTLSTANIRPLI